MTIIVILNDKTNVLLIFLMEINRELFKFGRHRKSVAV
jgi:hypothetical protein